MEKATAIVLRVVPWSETSCVVMLFSRELGRLQCLAKGARRPKGPFEAALDLLSRCRIVSLRKSSEALDLLTEAKLLKRFRPGSGDLKRLYAGYYVAELLKELTDDYDPHPELFDAAEGLLDWLRSDACAGSEAAEAGSEVACRLLGFELTALRLLGFAPALERCAGCDSELSVAGRVPFGPTSGGVLCPRCRPGRRQVVLLSVAAHGGLLALARGAAPDRPLARRTLGEMRAVLNPFVANLVGRKLRMHAYVSEI